MGKKNIAYINKDMLVWARNNTPFETVKDVSEKIKDISPEKLIAWEKGDDYPSISDAKKLAHLYKVPFACFYLSNVPEKKVKKYIDRRTLKGTVYTTQSYQLWSEIERISSNREYILNLNSDIEYDFIPSIPRDYTCIQIADNIRGFLDIKVPFSSKSAYKNNSFSYFRRIIENKSIMVAQIVGVSLEEMKGISISEERLPIIAINNKDYDRAKTFSLMHEIAHIFRRTSSLCLIDFDDRNDEEEKICDSIAVNILAPEKNFRSIVNEINVHAWSYDNLIRIGDRFAISAFTVLRRLYELRYINYSEYCGIYSEIEKQFIEEQKYIDEKKKEREFAVKYFYKYLGQEGYLFPRSIISAYNSGILSFGEACESLRINSKHFENIAKAVMF